MRFLTESFLENIYKDSHDDGTEISIHLMILALRIRFEGVFKTISYYVNLLIIICKSGLAASFQTTYSKQQHKERRDLIDVKHQHYYTSDAEI